MVWRYRLPVDNHSGYSTLQMAADGSAANLYESSADCHHISHTESGPASLSLAQGAAEAPASAAAEEDLLASAPRDFPSLKAGETPPP